MCWWNWWKPEVESSADPVSMNDILFFYSGAAVGGQGMSEADRKVCMVEDLENLSPLAEAYARARGM